MIEITPIVSITTANIPFPAQFHGKYLYTLDWNMVLIDGRVDIYIHDGLFVGVPCLFFANIPIGGQGKYLTNVRITSNTYITIGMGGSANISVSGRIAP